MPTTFADVGVPDDLCTLLARRGVAEPFPIQAATLPDALAGRDICGRAPTGSGKTLAFGLTIAVRARRGASRRPTVLVLVPTRELAAQVARELDALGSYHGHKVVTVYGGTGYGPQRQALRKGASIVVACPGRLEDLVQQGDVSLADVDLVVLDEADRMANMGFLPVVRRLLDQTSTERQTLLFSATLDKEIDVLVRRYQNDPARHEVFLDEAESGEVSHEFWRVDRSERLKLAAALVRQHGRVLVFCRTRRGADRLTKQLSQFGVDTRTVHGSRSQSQREKALSAFARGRVDALVATDVAARGIHVDDVACVLHFDIPADPKDYIHRSGRTGRAGADGIVVSLIVNEQRKEARALQRALDLPEELITPDLPRELLEAREPIKSRTEPEHATERRPRKGSGPRRGKPGEARSGRPHRPARPQKKQSNGTATGGRRGNGASEGGSRPPEGKAGSEGSSRRPAGNSSGNRSNGNNQGAKAGANGTRKRSGRPYRGKNAGRRKVPAGRS